MLKSRNLDDQNFSDIVEHAVKRIPQLCEGWTNYNAPDPGITLIELLAWYKEMQQYHMNYYTDDMKLKLLKLLGTAPAPVSPAECIIETEENGAAHPAGSRLSTPEGVIFELSEPVSEKRTITEGFYAVKGERVRDITPVVRSTGSVLNVFSFGVNDRTGFVIAFSELEKEELSLWVDVVDHGNPRRNPFEEGQSMPRKLRWEMLGYGETEPVTDETFSLSRSGFIRFRIPAGWTRQAFKGLQEPCWLLKLSVEESGCEEQVLLRHVSASKYRAVQQMTCSWMCTEKADKDGELSFVYDDALAYEGCFNVFARSDSGWSQCPFDIAESKKGRGVRLKCSGLSHDGKDNIIVCCADPTHYLELYLASDGLPGQSIHIETGGKQILKDRFLLICDTTGADGKVHQEIWHCVDDLKYCGPDDRVFSYDSEREEICFGDGEHGRLLHAGEQAVFIAQLVLTDGKLGNIPAGNRLSFDYSNENVVNTEAVNGRNAETLDEAAGRFLKQLYNPKVCVSAADYEHMAMFTPGRRVLAARAIPGYDPDEPTAASRGPVVTVVAVPAGTAERPMPDEAFLSDVRSFLEKRRMVCTVVKVIAPKYVPIEISAELAVLRGISEADIKKALEEQLRLSPEADSRRIGDPVQLAWVYSALQSIPGVQAVMHASVKGSNASGKSMETGDLEIPKYAIPYINKVHITQR